MFRKIECLGYVNIKQRLMIEHKLLKRNLEIEEHVMHFRVMNV